MLETERVRHAPCCARTSVAGARDWPSGHGTWKLNSIGKIRTAVPGLPGAERRWRGPQARTLEKPLPGARVMLLQVLV